MRCPAAEALAGSGVVPGQAGGGEEIRTPEGFPPTRFPSVRHRPLGESSVGQPTEFGAELDAAPWIGDRGLRQLARLTSRPLARRSSRQLPQGRKAARVRGLWRVCGGSLPSGEDEVMAADVPGPAPAETAERSAPGAPIALYRRYRPATFAEVRGQDHVTEPLRQALRSGRVHHAYLFSGPRGCGKTSSARILARSLNCESGPTPDPCGKCGSCVALAPTGPGSIDVIEIDAASHGGVDDARDLRERAFYAPGSGRFQIYIIDEAHMVTGGGFNALLKLVEERRRT